MNSIGEALRRERLRLNLDLDQVARETKISVKLLEAIEAEDFSKLPGGVFTKSFVRQYARLLGMDEDEAVAELQRTMQPEATLADTQEQPAPPEPVIDLPRVPDWAGVGRRRSSALPSLVLVVVVMLGCSAFYAWWQQRSRRPASVGGQPAQVSAPVAAPAAAPPPVIAAAETQAPANQQPAAPTADRPQPEANPVNAAPPAPAQQPSAAPAPTTPAVATAAGPATGNVRVMLTAAEPTWISVRSDGKVVWSGILQANEKKDLTADSQVRLVVGNAGGVSVTLNGQPVPPLGPKGQVRVVQFSPGGVQIVPRKPPAPDAL